MKIKIGILVLVLVLAGGGFFYRQNNQKDIQILNKNLPAGVKVVKSIFGFGNEYKVINKIDGYEFKVPSAWKGLGEIKYIPERTENGYTGASITIEGNDGNSRVIGLDRYKLKDNINLELWAKANFNAFGLVGDFNKEKIKEFEIIKTQENINFAGEYVYFFNINTAVYTITGPSEEFIQEIITNGRW